MSNDTEPREIRMIRQTVAKLPTLKLNQIVDSAYRRIDTDGDDARLVYAIAASELQRRVCPNVAADVLAGVPAEQWGVVAASDCA